MHILGTTTVAIALNGGRAQQAFRRHLLPRLDDEGWDAVEVVSAVVSGYVTLLELDRSLAITEATAAGRKRNVELFDVRRRGGKRTRVADYPVKGRGGLGVKTVQLTESKGQLAGSRVVRDGYQVMLISDGGTVIRMAVDDIKRSGRSTQGVIVMRLREGEHVSSLAPVVEPAEEAK